MSTLYNEYARMIFKADSTDELEKIEGYILTDEFLSDKERTILLSKVWSRSEVVWL